MCLIVFALQQHPDYPLVVLANRDEFYDRPSQQADFWPDAPELLAGRDLLAGGTWLGITRQGRFAAITNYRSPLPPEANVHSRGDLTRAFLLGDETPAQYLQTVAQQGERYSGFNLLTGQLGNKGQPELWYYGNRGGKLQQVPAGVHGLSNALLNSPWPKVDGGKQALASALAAGADCEQLLDLLQDESQPPDEQLPDTGVGLDAERMLSPRLIRSSDYGTRASTVLSVNRDGKVIFRELNYDARGKAQSLNRFEFSLQDLS